MTTKAEELWATLTPAEIWERVLFCRDRLGDPGGERTFLIRYQIAMATKDRVTRLAAEKCTHEWALLIEGPGAEALYGCVWCPLNWNVLDGELP